jgi:hypothetical protein
MYAEVMCSNQEGVLPSYYWLIILEYTLDTAIPANTLASVHVNKLALSNVLITESNQPVWQDGSFVSGVPGILNGVDNGQEIVFETGSGYYSFFVTGELGVDVCGSVAEVINIIDFVLYNLG